MRILAAFSRGGKKEAWQKKLENIRRAANYAVATNARNAMHNRGDNCT